MPSYPASDATLHYDERGGGERVVVLGGGPARHPDYLGDLAGLGGSRSLVLPHLRGVGGSRLPEDLALASWWNQAADVEALRRHLGVGRLTVLGHSAGTWIAMAFAARFPGSLERLVLITPPAADLVDVAGDVPAVRQRRSGEPAYRAALETAQQGPPADADDESLTRWQRAVAPIGYARWEAAQQAHSRIGPWSARAGAAYGALRAPAGFTARLAAVRAPVRVVAAAEDGLTGLAGPLAVAGLFADGRGTSIEGAGHYPFVDRPAEFLAAAQAALAD